MRAAVGMLMVVCLAWPSSALADVIATASKAIDTAAAIPGVRAQLVGHGNVNGDAAREPNGRWLVVFGAGGSTRAVVELRASTGAPIHVFTGLQAQYPLARGRDSGLGERKINSLWAWLPLTAIFLLAFFDWRRPLRLLHLDLAAVAALGISYAFFMDAHIRTSVPLVYPLLVYMAGRALIAGARPRDRAGPLSPLSARTLAVLVIALLVGRIVLGLADGHVLDVGYASAAGADRLLHGHEIYNGSAHFDTYGAVTYFAYAPFVLLFGFHTTDLVPAASQAAAITFELLTVAGLVVLGRRARPGTNLGWALALAWVACPFTGIALDGASNDALVSALVVWTFVAFASPAARGALTGLAGAAKFMPLLTAPLLARRRPLVFGLALAVTALVPTLLLLPPGGVSQFYDATVGFQLHRFTPFSIWNQHPSLEWLQTIVKLGVLALALIVAVRPRGPRTLAQTAGLAAAVLISAQLPLEFWFYLYVTWFLPLYCFALFTEHVADERPAASQP